MSREIQAVRMNTGSAWLTSDHKMLLQVDHHRRGMLIGQHPRDGPQDLLVVSCAFKTSRTFVLLHFPPLEAQIDSITLLIPNVDARNAVRSAITTLSISFVLSPLETLSWSTTHRLRKVMSPCKGQPRVNQRALDSPFSILEASTWSMYADQITASRYHVEVELMPLACSIKRALLIMYTVC